MWKWDLTQDYIKQKTFTGRFPQARNHQSEPLRVINILTFFIERQTNISVRFVNNMRKLVQCFSAVTFNMRICVQRLQEECDWADVMSVVCSSSCLT